MKIFQLMEQTKELRSFSGSVEEDAVVIAAEKEDIRVAVEGALIVAAVVRKAVKVTGTRMTAVTEEDEVAVDIAEDTATTTLAVKDVAGAEEVRDTVDVAADTKIVVVVVAELELEVISVVVVTAVAVVPSKRKKSR